MTLPAKSLSSKLARRGRDMRVTDLVASGEMIRVVVDNRPIGRVTAATVLRLDLRAGQELSAAQFRRLREAVTYAGFYQEAGRYCARRLRSREEVRVYLAKHSCPLVLAKRVIDQLVSSGLIDEEQLAAALIHDAGLGRPLSRLALEKKLQGKHLDPELIDRVLEKAGTNDERALLEAIAKKQGQPSYLKDKPKLFRYLLRQGFAYSLIVKHLGRPY